MARRSRAARLLFLFTPAAVLGGIVFACSADFTPAPDCKGSGCTCEQDPQQARCRGFSPEEGGSFEGGTRDDATFDSGKDAANDVAADVDTDTGADADDGAPE